MMLKDLSQEIKSEIEDYILNIDSGIEVGRTINNYLKILEYNLEVQTRDNLDGLGKTMIDVLEGM